MFGNLFGGSDNNLFLILIILFLFGGFGGDRCGDRGGIFDGDNILLIILLLFLLGDNDDCGCR